MASFADRQSFYAGIISTALEGGIGYWSAAEEYRWFDPYLEGGSCEPGPQGTANAYAVIVPADEESSWAEWPEHDGGQRVRVGIELVRRAVNQIVRGEVGHHIRDDIVTKIRRGLREWDAGEIDADAADVIVQVGVFGKVVFG